MSTTSENAAAPDAKKSAGTRFAWANAVSRESAIRLAVTQSRTEVAGTAAVPVSPHAIEEAPTVRPRVLITRPLPDSVAEWLGRTCAI